MPLLDFEDFNCTALLPSLIEAGLTGMEEKPPAENSDTMDVSCLATSLLRPDFYTMPTSRGLGYTCLCNNFFNFRCEELANKSNGSLHPTRLPAIRQSTVFMAYFYCLKCFFAVLKFKSLSLFFSN